MPDIKITNLYKKFDKNRQVIENLNLSMKQGEILSILGPNGCGKSTLLNVISALPIIFAGLRIALSLSLVVAIASEMIIGGTRGLGKKIMDDMVVYNLTEMYAIIILIGSLGFISNKLFSVLENKIIHWKGHN
ncbi:hypothetical protein A2Y83_00895 [Candidatus Falkowbacteria bacterium RBG_13_39_14]|uniref:ABC transporter domain-containing protein n=1 Tax=Candidatus Falkowbacteria bacterium RBG_13_39_14 TaxID=1797985 RepID=A0A1F5S5A9_9BACT|nr:MAG: hypothetical protein A2Y83_00895 [Candidatus Falkowbacteria bacterium RBG_13_39_14]